MSRPTAGAVTLIAATGLSLLGLALVLTRQNHGLLELVIAALAGLGGFTLRAWLKG